MIAPELTPPALPVEVFMDWLHLRERFIDIACHEPMTGYESFGGTTVGATRRKTIPPEATAIRLRLASGEWHERNL